MNKNGSKTLCKEHEFIISKLEIDIYNLKTNSISIIDLLSSNRLFQMKQNRLIYSKIATIVTSKPKVACISNFKEIKKIYCFNIANKKDVGNNP